MKSLKFFALGLLLVVFLTGCTAAANELAGTPAANGEAAGFWQGLWHGFISPFTFLISLFNHDIGIYEVHNNGNWYNFGFMFGVSMILGGGGRGSSYRRRHKKD